MAVATTDICNENGFLRSYTYEINFLLYIFGICATEGQSLCCLTNSVDLVYLSSLGPLTSVYW